MSCRLTTDFVNRNGFAAAVFLLTLGMGAIGTAQPTDSTLGVRPPQSIAVPIKVLATASPVAMDANMQPAAGIETILPSVRHSQYTAPTADQDPIAITVSSGTQSFRLSIEVLLDGKPFADARRERIAEWLNQATQSAGAESKISEAAIASTLQSLENLRAPDNSEDDETSEDGKPITPSPETSGRSVPYSFASTPEEILARYVAAVGRSDGQAVAPEQTEELNVHFGIGASQLWLRPNFQSFRATWAPIVSILDSDSDGKLSSAELTTAAERLLSLDADRNEIVEVSEIDSAWHNYRSADVPGPQTAIVTTRGIDSDELPTVHWTIDFNSSAPSQSTSTLIVDQRLNIDQPTAQDDCVELRLDGKAIELGAVVPATLKADDSLAFSIGWVVDGYPLLPLVDAAGDGRITLRRLQTLSRDLLSVDRDGDGQLSGDELGPPLRIAVGLGPIVDDNLAKLRPPPSRLRSTPSDDAPPWFTRMDINRDGDLSRREFPGTDEQFAALDSDDDTLVDAQEAAASARVESQ